MTCDCEIPVDNPEDKSELELTENQMLCRLNCDEQQWQRGRTNFGTAKSLRESQEDDEN
jgi:hypothetical protein